MACCRVNFTFPVFTLPGFHSSLLNCKLICELHPWQWFGTRNRNMGVSFYCVHRAWFQSQPNQLFLPSKLNTSDTLFPSHMFRHSRGAIIKESYVDRSCVSGVHLCLYAELIQRRILCQHRIPWWWHPMSAETCRKVTVRRLRLIFRRFPKITKSDY
jgi:hypothetical protein